MCPCTLRCRSSSTQSQSYVHTRHNTAAAFLCGVLACWRERSTIVLFVRTVCPSRCLISAEKPSSACSSVILCEISRSLPWRVNPEGSSDFWRTTKMTSPGTFPGVFEAGRHGRKGVSLRIGVDWLVGWLVRFVHSVVQQRRGQKEAVAGTHDRQTRAAVCLPACCYNIHSASCFARQHSSGRV